MSRQIRIVDTDHRHILRHPDIALFQHPEENLGKKAAETLLQMIAGKKKDLTYEFDTRVVERESVAEHKTL